MTQDWISLLVRRRWLLFLLSCLLMAFALTGFRQFVFDSSPRVFFDDDNADYERFEALEDTYGRDFRLFFMLSAEDGDVFQPSHLQALREMTERCWQLAFVRRVDSLSNFQYSHSEGDDLFVEDLLSDDIINDPERLAARKAIALSDPDIVGRLVAKNGGHAAIVLALNMTPEDVQTPASAEMVKQARALADEIAARYPGVTFAATGNLLSTYYNMEVAQQDMAVMVPLMFGLMFVFLGFMLRSMSTVVVTLVIAFCSALGALGLSAWLGITFSILASNALIIGITVAVAHCVHIFTQLFKDLQRLPKAEALVATLRTNFLAVSMTSLTTVLGFLSLNTNDLPPAAALGNAAAIATALAWLLSFTVLPALVMLLPFKAHTTSEYLIEGRMSRLGEWVIRYPYSILVLMMGLSIGALYLSFNNRLNDNLIQTLHEPHIFRSDTQAIDKQFGALYINNYDMDSGSENGIVDPRYLREMDKFVTYLRSQPEVSSVHAFSDIIKRLNQSMHGEDPAYYTIPDDRELISQYLLLYEMSLPFGLDLNEMVTPDKRRSVVVVGMPSQDTHTDIAVDQRIWEWQQKNLPPEYQARNISLSNIWSYLTIHSLTNSLQGSIVALVLISAVMLLMLRSLRYGVISLIPNLLPAAFGFGAWYFISGNVGLGLTCVVIITMGIVVDDTVHFLVKYQRALKENGGNAEQAVRATFHQVGSAIFITTVVLAAGFGVLGLSQIVINSALGQVTAVILLAAFLLDVLLLPVLLLMADRRCKPAVTSQPLQSAQPHGTRHAHSLMSVQGVEKMDQI